MALTGGIAVIFGLGAVADDEYLHIFKQRITCPERFTPVAVDLVKRLLKQHAASFQLDVYQRQPVHEDGHVITVLVASVAHLILVDDLGDIGMDILLIDEFDVTYGAIVKGERFHTVLLNCEGFILDALSLVGNFGLEETLPFTISKHIIIETLQLATQIIDKFILLMYVQALVALARELFNKFTLQFLFTLIGRLPDFRWPLVMGNHR